MLPTLAILLQTKAFLISGLLAHNFLQAFAGALETLVPLASPLGTLTSPFNVSGGQSQS